MARIDHKLSLFRTVLTEIKSGTHDWRKHMETLLSEFFGKQLDRKLKTIEDELKTTKAENQSLKEELFVLKTTCETQKESSDHHMRDINGLRELVSECLTQHQQNITPLPLIPSQETVANDYILALTFGCCCLSALFAVFGNIMIIWIIGWAKSMRTPTNLFIANLAISDIMVGALVIPFQFQTTLLKRWLLPHFMCYVSPTIQVIAVSNSVYTLTAIALERYRAVMYPLRAHVTKLNAKVEILGIWIFSILLSIPTIIALKVHLIWDELTEEKTMPFCQNIGLTTALFGTYKSALVFVHYFIPLCVISYTYIRMALALSREEEAIDSTVRVNNINIKRKKKK
ncbi:unnamed protein product, partial [Oppiella nova]